MDGQAMLLWNSYQKKLREAGRIDFFEGGRVEDAKTDAISI